MTRLHINLKDGKNEMFYVSNEDVHHFNELSKFIFGIHDGFVFVEDLAYQSMAFNIDEVKSMELENDLIKDID